MIDNIKQVSDAVQTYSLKQSLDINANQMAQLMNSVPKTSVSDGVRGLHFDKMA